MNKKKLIIFDCDGVLVDSEPLSLKALQLMLKKKSLNVSIEECFELFLGKNFKDTKEIIRSKFGINISKNDEALLHENLFFEIDNELREIPGVADFIDTLSIKYCVASSSGVNRIFRSLAVTNLLDYFKPEQIFSSSMVLRGKPFPDLFLFAATSMGFEPEDCIVIEDSQAGINAAISAEMTVVGFTGGEHYLTTASKKTLRDTSADYICNTYDELSEIISKLI